MRAPSKHDYPVLDDVDTLKEYDAFLFGIPTRYGNFPAQWKVRAPIIWPTLSDLIWWIIRTGSLGQNWRHLGEGVARGQVRWSVRIH